MKCWTPRVITLQAKGFIASAMVFALNCLAQTNVTPAQYLASLPKPQFAPGHLLPHLTRWGWQLSSNACIEVAQNWGYTLDLGECASWMISSIQDTNTMVGQFVSMGKGNPRTFALSVELSRSFPAPIAPGFYCTNAVGLYVDSSGHQWAEGTNAPYTKIVSPIGPDAYWDSIAESQISPLRSIHSNAPVAIILNGGEYGLDVSGFGVGAWYQVPGVNVTNNPADGFAYLADGTSWPQYASNRKAQQLSHVTFKINQVLPDRETYVFYNTSIESTRTVLYQPWNGSSWGFLSDPYMTTNADLPNLECYYKGSWTNSPFNYYGKYSFTPDLLTEYLNAVGYNIAHGRTKNYTWVSGGWDQGNGPSDFADIPRYMGFLKCLYTGGMVGGVAGAFTYPTNGFDATFATNSPPQWLLQMVALSRVHALFTKLENFLYNGDLLPGPQMHSMSTDQPAYEVTNSVADVFARVMARKLQSTNQWLITAWAQDGTNRNVTVTIPTLGPVTVLARDSGSVYLATTNSLVLTDVDGVLPTESTAVAPASNLKVLSAGK